MYNPKAIANYFLYLAKAKGEALTPMKLQKLVYYAHGWYAGYTGQPLINESVEAWQYGPVIPSLYHEFKQFGAGPIDGKAADFNGLQFKEVPVPIDPSVRGFLDSVWSSYGQLTGIALSDMTHAEGSPWDRTWKECAGLRGKDIPFEQIKIYFKELADKANEKAALQ